MGKKTSEESVVATWIFVIILALAFFVFGFSTFLLVGDKGPPAWNYATVKDVPGESPYAIYEPLPYPQHVRGQKGE